VRLCSSLPDPSGISSGSGCGRCVISIQRLQVLAHRAATTPVIVVVPMPPTARIRLHHTGIHRKALATDQTFDQAALQHHLEQLPECFAVPEPAVPVLGESGMVRHLAFKPQPAKPPVGQIEMHFLTQPPFRADAVTRTNDEHADHYLGINRGTTGRAVESGKVCAQVA